MCASMLADPACAAFEVRLRQLHAVPLHCHGCMMGTVLMANIGGGPRKAYLEEPLEAYDTAL